MGLDDIVDKAKDAAEAVKDKAGDAIHSEQAEKISDAVLDGGEKAANFVTGGRFEEEIGEKRDAVDARIGDDGTRASGRQAKGGGGR